MGAPSEDHQITLDSPMAHDLGLVGDNGEGTCDYGIAACVEMGQLRGVARVGEKHLRRLEECQMKQALRHQFPWN